MNDDITAALRGFAETQRLAAGTTAPDHTAESTSLARRVTRRRAVRTGSVALTAAVVVGGVVVGSLLSGSRTPAPPAIPAPTTTTTPAPTPSSPSATPTSSPTGAALSAAEPMPTGMLEASGAGWNLLRYGAADQQEGEVLPATLYLLDPDGRPFVVPTPADPAGWYLLDWLPGSALVLAQSVDDGATRVLDVLTGEAGATLGTGFGEAWFAADGSTDVVMVAEGAGVLRVSADGVAQGETSPFGYQYGSTIAIASPDATRIVLNDVAGPRLVSTVDFSPLPMAGPYPDRPDACRAWMWVDDSDVLLECAAGGDAMFMLGNPTEFWLDPADGGAPRSLRGMPDSARLGGVWRVAGRLVVGTFGPSETEAGWWEVADEGLVPLSAGGDPQLRVVDVRGSELLAVRQPHPSPEEGSTADVVAIDPVRGSTRVLVVGEPAWFSPMAVTPGPYAGAPQTGIGD